MIKANIEGKEGTAKVIRFEMSGSLKDICADSIMILRMAYEGISGEDEKAAEEYKNIITRAINDELPFIGTAGLREKVDELRSEEKTLKEEMSKLIKELNEHLKKALDIEEDEDE